MRATLEVGVSFLKGLERLRYPHPHASVARSWKIWYQLVPDEVSAPTSGNAILAIATGDVVLDTITTPSDNYEAIANLMGN
jgi:hypothetical protein